MNCGDEDRLSLVNAIALGSPLEIFDALEPGAPVIRLEDVFAVEEGKGAHTINTILVGSIIRISHKPWWRKIGKKLQT